MFLRQLQLIVSALTCSLSVICAFLYQLPLLKLIAILGLLWSIYACYKIFSFNSKKISKSVDEKEDLEMEKVRQRKLKYFYTIKKFPIISIRNPQFY